MKNNKALGNFLKYTTYIVFIFSMYLIQVNPVFLNFQGQKPNLLFSCAVVISMLEGEFIGGILGMLCGMLCDLGSYNAFGFHTILLMLLCIASGLLVIYYMQNSHLNALMLIFAALSIRGMLEFFFVYVMWGYEDMGHVLFDQIIPVVVYSLFFTIPIHMLFQRLHSYFSEKYHI